MNNKTTHALLAILLIVSALQLPAAAKFASLLDRLQTPGATGVQSAPDFSFVKASPGTKVDIKTQLVPQKYTIVDFQSKYCPDCRKMKPLLLELSKARKDIAVRLVDIDRPGSDGIDWSSPVAKQYKIREIPQFKIFDASGNLIAQGDQATSQVIKSIQQISTKHK